MTDQETTRSLEGGDIDDWFARRAAQAPNSAALVAPDRPALTSIGLHRQIRTVAAALDELGVRRSSRVAVLMPTGPEMAVVSLGVASHAAAAPLNPSYRTQELEFEFADLGVTALAIDSQIDSPAREVARRQRIPIIEVSRVEGAEAGAIDLRPMPAGLAVHSPAQPHDIALVLHTSGTTSRPKIVPLTHANLRASSVNMARVFGLRESDRCLDVNSLFHIHGLMVMLASLLSGGSVAFLPPLQVERFFAWLADLRPTWYSAVPTIHYAILASAELPGKITGNCSLRFIRSCSAPLGMRALVELERTFKVPVIESYGMTEGAHQIATNPLPPCERKPGSVGLSAGPQVAILDDAGTVLAAGQVGEIAIRGASVIEGYENNPAANAAAFTNGWLRTGDQGYVDEHGYVFIAGRIKELINRGGEKISPREVDDVLIEHPAIARAVTFPLPHPTLGEDIAAAVVLRNGASASAASIREFAAGRLAEFKVPRRLAIVPSIPTGPTGKYQRSLLAKQLGLLDESSGARQSQDTVAPIDPLELVLVAIWERLFDIRPIGVTDDFFELGGDSLLATVMVEEIEQTCGWTVAPSSLFAAPTIERLARELLAQRNAVETGPALVKVSSSGSRFPFVLLHGDYNGGGFYTRLLARHLSSDQPLYAFPPHGSSGDPVPPTIEAMADDYLTKLCAELPDGPYLLGGFSTAGLVAFEVAQRLHARGKRPALLVVIDMPVEDPRWRVVRGLTTVLGRSRGIADGERHASYRLWKHRITRLGELARSGPRAQASYLLTKVRLKARPTAVAPRPPASTDQRLGRRQMHLIDTYRPIVEGYIPRPYPGRITLIVSAERRPRLVADPTMGWARVARDVRVVEVPGDHLGCVTTHVQHLAEQLANCLREVQSDLTTPSLARPGVI